MGKKNGMLYVYGIVLFVCFAFLALMQFYPELFAMDNKTRGISEIILGSLGFVVVGFWEKERKKSKGDLK